MNNLVTGISLGGIIWIYTVLLTCWIRTPPVASKIFLFSVTISGIIISVILGIELIGNRFKRKSQNRALLLFKSYLNDEQKSCFKRNQYIWVIGNVTNHNYLIGNGYVTCAETGTQYCCYVPHVPKYDNHLAQKIVIENDENHFLATAVQVRTW